MACNFGNGLIGERHAVATVARGNDFVDRSSAYPTFLKDVVKHFFSGTPGMVTGRGHCISNQQAIFGHRRLGGNGTHINTDRKHSFSFNDFEKRNLDCGIDY
jgi:hypothetical protein